MMISEERRQQNADATEILMKEIFGDDCDYVVFVATPMAEGDQTDKHNHEMQITSNTDSVHALQMIKAGGMHVLKKAIHSTINDEELTAH